MIDGAISTAVQDDPPRARVFCCTSCGSPLSVGTRDVVRCSFCQTDNALPAEIQRQREERDTRDRLRIDARYAAKRFLERPSRAFLFLVALIDQPLLPFVLLYLLPISVVVIRTTFYFAPWFENWYSRMGGRPPYIVEPMVLVFVQLFVWAFLPRALGVYAARRALATAAIAQALEARTPALLGGVCECRSCGAPVEIGPDVVFQSCLYCGCDNLRSVGRGEIDHERTINSSIATTIEEAIEIDRRERDSMLRKLRNELGRYALRMGVFGALFVTSAVSRGNSILPVICAFSEVGLVIYWIVVDAQKRDHDSARIDAMLALPRWLVTLASLAWALTLTVGSLFLF